MSQSILESSQVDDGQVRGDEQGCGGGGELHPAEDSGPFTHEARSAEVSLAEASGDGEREGEYTTLQPVPPDGAVAAAPAPAAAASSTTNDDAASGDHPGCINSNCLVSNCIVEYLGSCPTNGHCKDVDGCDGCSFLRDVAAVDELDRDSARGTSGSEPASPAAAPPTAATATVAAATSQPAAAAGAAADSAGPVSKKARRRNRRRGKWHQLDCARMAVPCTCGGVARPSEEHNQQLAFCATDSGTDGNEGE